jgi:hypothetical protein
MIEALASTSSFFRAANVSRNGDAMKYLAIAVLALACTTGTAVAVGQRDITYGPDRSHVCQKPPCFCRCLKHQVPVHKVIGVSGQR